MMISKRFLKISQYFGQKNLMKTSAALNAKSNEKEMKVEAEKTALYEFHTARNGKMINFGGYLLPEKYNDLSIVASHLHTRKSSSIFDVSHMLQTRVHGTHAIQCIESICTADLHRLPINSSTLTIFTNDDGNILDDLIVSKISENELYIVSNAGMKMQDMEVMQNAVTHFNSSGKNVNVNFFTTNERSLLAIQGPKSIDALQSLTNTNLSQLYFMNTVESEIVGIKNCRITRCGYTGEDGFEISLPAEKSIELVESLLNYEHNEIVKLAGLAARDSLRLEAGLCLYGSDVNATISPIEADLAWLVGKRRRTQANFPGATKINEQLSNGVARKRVGIRMISGPPARHDTHIFNKEGKEIGIVTSGCPSPSLGGNVAMGYVQDLYKKIGTEINLKIRDKFYPAEITKMPFVPSQYYKK